jgi:hypothetical protein
MNAVWFSYTPTTSHSYEITVTNGNSSVSESNLRVWEGGTCSSLGTELACVEPGGNTVSTVLELIDGTTYYIAYFTDGAWTFDPEISLAQVDGYICDYPVDVSAGPFPYQLLGDFTADPGITTGCPDNTPTNAVWYLFTAPVTANYDITAVNNTLANSWSRLAIFHTAACNPLGTELQCIQAGSLTIMATEFLTADETYLILFYTDGNGWPMEDPELTITGV